MSDLLIENGRIVTRDGERGGDIAIDDGRISAVGRDLEADDADRIDATDKFVLPGIIDPHVHVEWPGWDYDLSARAGSRAAAAGGITTFVNFLIGEPGKTRQRYDEFRSALEAHSLVDFSFHLGVFTDDQIDMVPDFVEEGITSFKIFLPYRGEEVVEPLVGVDDGIVYKLMQTVADQDEPARVLVHPENVEPSFKIKRDMRASGEWEEEGAITWARVRPAFLEVDAINRIGLFAEETGCPTHFVHMSSAAGVRAFRDVRARYDVKLSAEAQVQYLTEDARDHDLLAKVNPPIRTAAEHEALWEAVRRGEIAFLDSDHAPCSSEHKENIWDATVGIPNLQTWFPLVLTAVLDEGHLSLPELVEATTYNPAAHYGLTPRKGGLWPGADADVVIVDPEQRTKIRADDMEDQSDFTPFEGRSFATPEVTIARGDVVYRDGTVTGEEGRAEFLARPKP